jgi:ribonuclease J
MMALRDELVFVPLGGVGEIGMNLGLYGLGPRGARKWLVVDFGIAFAGPDLPGVEVIYPDITFLETERRNIAGIVITHAHEDHYGALLDLWPRVKAPVYATPFTAGLLAAKRQHEAVPQEIPLTIVEPGGRFSVGPFDVEMIAVAHSIPEPTALALHTPLGVVVHTGDWKIDPEPIVGPAADEKRLRELGAAGVLALVCDSTNATRDGRSPREVDVARELAAIVQEARGRVIFTTFASNVARIRSIAEAAAAAGRHVVIIGRALHRTIDVAAELGYLRGLKPFLDAAAFNGLPRNKVVAIVTGSQGEPRAALSRAAEDDHGELTFSAGDLVVFSSRPIPGNEKAIGAIINNLITEGVSVITDRDRLVHASGHPRRDELGEIYSWLKPEIVVPVHGEAVHLAAQAEYARAFGIERVLRTMNGRMVRLAPQPAEDVDEIHSGRLYRDGNLIGNLESVGIVERRRLAFSGHVSVAVAVNAKGEVLGDPEIGLSGLPLRDGVGMPLEDRVLTAVNGTLDSIPRARRRDPDVLREAIRKAVRAEVREAWGKKPVCTVLITVI